MSLFPCMYIKESKQTFSLLSVSFITAKYLLRSSLISSIKQEVFPKSYISLKKRPVSVSGGKKRKAKE